VAAVVVWALDQEAPILPRSAYEWTAAFTAVLLYAGATALRGERWLWLLRYSGERPSRGDAYSLTAVGYMGNNVLPARGGDLLRIYLMARVASTAKRTVVGSLVAERLLDVVTLFVFFVVLAYFVLDDVEAPSGALLALGVLGFAVLLVLLLIAVLAVRRRGLLRRVRHWLRPALAASRSLRGLRLLSAASLTAVIWLLESSTYLAVGRAVGWDMNAAQAIYVVALTGLFVTIPAGPGNAGTLDAGVLLAVKALDQSARTALSYLLLLRFVLLIPVTVAGLVLVVTRYGGFSAFRRREERVA
jgi:uncharacterized protein (TIRG00374 family)